MICHADGISSVLQMIDKSIVSGRDIIRTENIRQLHQLGPLDVPVALDARVGRKALKIVVYKGSYNVLVKEHRTVVGVVSYVQYPAGAPGFIYLAASAVFVIAAPYAERHAQDFISLLLEQIRRHGAVYSSGHSDDDFCHCITATTLLMGIP